MKPYQILLMAALVSAGYAQAADPSCTALTKAANLGVAQAKLHQAAYVPFFQSTKPADKSKGSADGLSHTIFVGTKVYSDLFGNGRFSTEEIKSVNEKGIKAVLFALQDIDEKCRSVGNASLAGRNAKVYEVGNNKTPEDRYFKVWVDAKTELPIGMMIDESEPEVSNFSLTKDRKPNIEVKRTVKRMVTKVGFVYGDIVKAPTVSGSADLFDSKAGKMDADAVERLRRWLTACSN